MLSPQAFTRKYQMLRSNMRQREITQRLLEHRLDTREETLLHCQESHKIELSALKKTLKDIYEGLITTSSSTNPAPSIPSGSAVSLKQDDKLPKIRQSRQMTNISLEEQSLKAILYRLTGIGSQSSNQITISDKLTHLSLQMTQLTAMAENNSERVESMEEKNLKLELDNEKLKEENQILLRSITDLRQILEVPSPSEEPSGAGTNAVNNKKQQLQYKQQTKAIALKVFNLNDEVKGLKVQTVQQKREISLLQHEKKYLKSILSRLEADLQVMEEGKLHGNHNRILPPELTMEDEDDPLIAEFIKLRDDLFSYPSAVDDGSQNQPRQKKPSPVRSGIGLTVQTSEDDEGTLHRPAGIATAPGNPEEITKEELFEKMEKTTAEMLAAKREFNQHTRQIDSLHNKIQELQEVIADQEEHIAYYERMAAHEGLPTIRGRESAAGGAHESGRRFYFYPLPHCNFVL